MNDAILYVQRRFTPDARDTAVIAEIEAAGRQVDVIVGGLAGRDWSQYGQLIVAHPTTHGDLLPDGDLLDGLPVTVVSMCAATSVTHLGLATTALSTTTDQVWRLATDLRATEPTLFFPSTTIEALGSVAGDVTVWYDNNSSGASIAERTAAGEYRRAHMGLSNYDAVWTGAAAERTAANAFLFGSMDPIGQLSQVTGATVATVQASTSPTLILSDTRALMYGVYTFPLVDTAFVTEVSDSVAAAENILARLGVDASLRATMSDPVESLAAYSSELSLTGIIRTALRVAELVDISDSATMQEQVLVGLSVLQRLTAAATDTTESMASRLAELLDTAVADGRLDYAAAAQITDTVTALGALEVGLQVQLLDALTADLTAEYSMSISITDTLAAEVSDSTQAVGHYVTNVRDLAGAWVTFKVSGEVIQGWVMNLEGGRPLSQYENFAFNSMAEVGGVYYAASDEGLFELGGDTDDGAQIDAWLKTLVVDFDTSKLKRVVSAYLGYTSNGKVLLKVRSVDEGRLVEHWYSANEVVADAPRENYVTLGRGLKSRYWQFELTNVDGADFEIDQLEVLPLVLGRRV